MYEGTSCKIEGTPTKGGYRQLRRSNKAVYAHRAAWEDENGPIPDGLFVLHHCDNPPCSEVRHLFLGTQAENMADCKAKGRNRWRTKLTADQVAEARLRVSNGESQSSVARHFGVVPSTISLVMAGLTWKGR